MMNTKPIQFEDVSTPSSAERIRVGVLNYLDQHIHARENDAALLHCRYDTRLAIIAEGRIIRDELRELLDELKE